MTTDLSHISPPAFIGSPAEKLRAARDYVVSLEQRRRTRDGFLITDAHISRALDVVHNFELEVERAAAIEARRAVEARTPTSEWAAAEAAKRRELAMRGQIDADPAMAELYRQMKSSGRYD